MEYAFVKAPAFPGNPCVSHGPFGVSRLPDSPRGGGRSRLKIESVGPTTFWGTKKVDTQARGREMRVVMMGM